MVFASDFIMRHFVSARRQRVWLIIMSTRDSDVDITEIKISKSASYNLRQCHCINSHRFRQFFKKANLNLLYWKKTIYCFQRNKFWWEKGLGIQVILTQVKLEVRKRKTQLKKTSNALTLFCRKYAIKPRLGWGPPLPSPASCESVGNVTHWWNIVAVRYL